MDPFHRCYIPQFKASEQICIHTGFATLHIILDIEKQEGINVVTCD